jgi:cytoskeletal protein CcmA (bactofilin family)
MALFGKPPETKPAEGIAPRPTPAPQPPPQQQPQGATGRPVCVIGTKTTIKGEVSGDEDVLVEGTVEGQIRITKDLRVGNSGVVRATVEAQSIVVSGEVAGDVAAANRVEIQATGRLTGNIRAPKVVIAEGAMFKGNSDMSRGGAGAKDERKDKAAAL